MARKGIWPWIAVAAFAACLGGTYLFYTSDARKFEVSRETGVDVITTDAKTGATVSRDRRTGKIIFMDINDVNPDEAYPAIAPVPGWVPMCPGVRSVAAGSHGALVLRTEEPIAGVVTFYEAEMAKQGIALNRAGSAQRVILTGKRGAAHLTLTVTKDEAGAALEISMTGSEAK